MANQCNVVVIEEVFEARPDGWTLCFQWCRYEYADRTKENGFRFIWRWPQTGNLQAARGQARIPSIAVLQRLVAAADEAGWGGKVAIDAADFSA